MSAVPCRGAQCTLRRTCTHNDVACCIAFPGSVRDPFTDGAEAHRSPCPARPDAVRHWHSWPKVRALVAHWRRTRDMQGLPSTSGSCNCLRGKSRSPCTLCLFTTCVFEHVPSRAPRHSRLPGRPSRACLRGTRHTFPSRLQDVGEGKKIKRFLGQRGRRRETPRQLETSRVQLPVASCRFISWRSSSSRSTRNFYDEYDDDFVEDAETGFKGQREPKGNPYCAIQCYAHSSKYVSSVCRFPNLLLNANGAHASIKASPNFKPSWEKLSQK